MTVLDDRALNRATLARQLLLERAERPALEVIDHLVGLQAQEPLEPYVGLWSRVAGFAPAELVGLMEERTVVRTHLQRRTIHLLTAADTLALRSLFQPMLVQRMYGTLKRVLPGVDLDELTAAGRPHFHAEPLRSSDVARRVAERWPEIKVRDLGDALTSLVELVQVPPRGIWGNGGAPAASTTIEAWLGRAPDPEPADAGELVLRYLRAYGPATSADVRSWSGLAGLPAVIKEVRPQLRTFRDARGRELLDVPDGPLPDPDTPAPPRFLPAFDNAVLGYDDRTRIIDVEHRNLSVAGARLLLVDGRVAATWTSSADGVTVHPLRPLTPAERDEVEQEGVELTAFLADGTPGKVQFE
ncbi:winged helix DNA-binding domain-containing protein [Pseudonocardia sp. CA-107938]|uniref:winged helix DNA-binding domain-containing protein n=1 Tax=Pseudonocardia sp. CA-107938 TaxID=3240021 RepID=UPI003D8C7632